MPRRTAERETTMVQWYEVVVEMNVKDADWLIKKSVDVFKTECPERYGEVNEQMSCDTVYGCVAFALAYNQHDFTADHKKGTTIYHSFFHAKYSWSAVMRTWFESIAPCLKDGSSMLVYSHIGHCEYVVKNGKAVIK